MAIGGRLGAGGGGDGSAASRTVVDHHLLAEAITQALADHPGQDVEGTARAGGDEETQRPRWPVLRHGRRRQRERGGQYESEHASTHGSQSHRPPEKRV